MIAGYLAWVHYHGLVALCSPGSGCARVETSAYATVLGLPVAVLGLVAYAAILVLLLLPWGVGRVLAAALAVSALGYSAYLTYVELFVIAATCLLCLASAAILTLLVPATMSLALRERSG